MVWGCDQTRLICGHVFINVQLFGDYTETEIFLYRIRRTDVIYLSAARVCIEISVYNRSFSKIEDNNYYVMLLVLAVIITMFLPASLSLHLLSRLSSSAGQAEPDAEKEEKS